MLTFTGVSSRGDRELRRPVDLERDRDRSDWPATTADAVSSVPRAGAFDAWFSGCMSMATCDVAVLW